MELDRAREDVFVAVAAALGTVAVTLAVRFGGLPDPGFLLRLAPLFVYFLYLFTRSGLPDLPYDTARNWGLAAVLVALATLGYALTL
ncbi:hypothetical protein [Haloparvum sedimenti]|uniref:hypothetical protein n=1 Tax=Haloparvum sedimenti TaxID=1678448 RepID=UPI00071E6F97|nr:hypothetical protein [Haloparvum sedimenti]